MKSASSTPSLERLPPHEICLEKCWVHYHHTIALEDISGVFRPSSLTAIAGPNGGGKSTLLKLIMGLVTPSMGGLKAKSPLRNIAYLPQLSSIDRTFPLKVFDVVATGLFHRQGLFKKVTDHTLVSEAIESIGLKGLESRPLHALSGGQFQRVLFARLQLQDAQILLLDEPFTGIDSHTIEDLMTLIKTWHKGNKMIITALHDHDLIREYFPETLLIARKIIAWGKTKETLTPDKLNMARDYACSWDSTLEYTTIN